MGSLVTELPHLLGKGQEKYLQAVVSDRMNEGNAGVSV
jgi:hypothetical protein